MNIINLCSRNVRDLNTDRVFPCKNSGEFQLVKRIAPVCHVAGLPVYMVEKVQCEMERIPDTLYIVPPERAELGVGRSDVLIPNIRSSNEIEIACDGFYIRRD